jgi:hypothetical protein
MSTVMKSDKIETPRTDAHTVDGQYREWTGGVTILQSWDYFPDKNGNGEVVHVEFARELERELITVTAERDALLKDRARLDWLDSNPLFPYLDFVYASGPMNGATPHGGWRTHIDAALRGEGEQ